MILILKVEMGQVEGGRRSGVDREEEAAGIPELSGTQVTDWT